MKISLTRALGLPFEKLALLIIWLWQRLFSLDHSFWGKQLPYRVCRHEPSCSEYARQSLHRFGFWKGSRLAVKRVLSCHPYSDKPAHDPVPDE